MTESPVTLREETKRMLGRIAHADGNGGLYTLDRDDSKRAYRCLLGLGFVAVNNAADPSGLCLTPAGRQWWDAHVDDVHRKATV